MSMSIQSAVEILSIQALEQYAKQHNLPTAEAVSLFYKHQVSFHTPLALKHLTLESRREVV